jgi:PiT family inorganic phosphate transporter
MGYTVFAWIGSLAGSLTLGYVIYSAVQFVL